MLHSSAQLVDYYSGLDVDPPSERTPDVAPHGFFHSPESARRLTHLHSSTATASGDPLSRLAAESGDAHSRRTLQPRASGFTGVDQTNTRGLLWETTSTVKRATLPAGALVPGSSRHHCNDDSAAAAAGWRISHTTGRHAQHPHRERQQQPTHQQTFRGSAMAQPPSPVEWLLNRSDADDSEVSNGSEVDSEMGCEVASAAAAQGAVPELRRCPRAEQHGWDSGVPPCDALPAFLPVAPPAPVFPFESFTKTGARCAEDATVAEASLFTDLPPLPPH